MVVFIRHPRSDLSEFNAYINNCLSTLDKESKEVYISGDFNIDLLKLPNNSSYQDFYNSMVGHGFLPQITYPTRAVNSSSTIIDNIYSNSVQHNHHSENILLNISEHFSQFLSVKRN